MIASILLNGQPFQLSSAVLSSTTMSTSYQPTSAQKIATETANAGSVVALAKTAITASHVVYPTATTPSFSSTLTSLILKLAFTARKTGSAKTAPASVFRLT